MWWSYLLENAVWSVGGLFVGYHIGRTERVVQDLSNRIEDKDDDHRDHS